MGPGDAQVGSRLGSVYRIPSITNPDDFAGFIQVCDGLSTGHVQLYPPGFKGLFWIAGGLGRTQYNHTLPPNSPSCWSPNPSINAYTAGSFHGGGANALALDGSVHFVKESIDPRVWYSAGTRAGGEIVGDGGLD